MHDKRRISTRIMQLSSLDPPHSPLMDGHLANYYESTRLLTAVQRPIFVLPRSEPKHAHRVDWMNPFFFDSGLTSHPAFLVSYLLANQCLNSNHPILFSYRSARAVASWQGLAYSEQFVSECKPSGCFYFVGIFASRYYIWA